MTITEQTAPLTVPALRGGCPFSPPPAYERARDETPVTRATLWDGSQAWLITRHEDIRQVLRDERFSSDGNKPGFPYISEARKSLTTTNASFIRMDDPEHARLRRMLTGDFMLKKVAAMRPDVQRIADGFVDQMTAAGRTSADLVTDFALPLPSMVICLMLGVPYEDHGFFQAKSRVLLANDSTFEEVVEARTSLNDYLARLAREKRVTPDDGIISRLAGRGELTDDEAAAMGTLLLVAGHETTANMTALSILTLLRNPDQLARLRANPSLVNSAVEEMLRYLTIIQGGLSRVAMQDVVVGGETVRAGEGVILMISAANRDESVFPSAGEVDIERDEARRHVAFGFGVHQCLGQPLARAELQIALETLLRRLPGLRLNAPFEDIPFRHDMLIYGVHSLPVAW